MLTIDIDTARRFILGKQGLWPGRRWRGNVGTAGATRAMEYLQLDPLQIIARSQDITLHSRVLDYTPGLWEEVTYQQRQFFDWGGWLATRPMEELPYWRVIMRREREGGPDHDGRIRAMAQEHADAIVEMRTILHERGIVNNRDFVMAARTRTQSYRGRKDSALALYYLWRTGEVMIHHRENFERVYALTETVAPPHLLGESDEEAADRFLIKKEISFAGLSRLNRAADAYFRGVPFSKAKQLCAALLADGEIMEVRVAGWKALHYALSSDAAVLADLSAGRIPQAWTPLATTTTQEVVFLAPLDPVSARGRAKLLFDFDYVWEVYKPEHQRKFGYYTLPVLWGDRLVARFDSKLDRAQRASANTFIILGFWLEDATLGQDDTFAAALAPLATTTTEEVVFLAPLDPVSARGRANVLFGFDYVWEVYKPEHQRKFGYYTLPVLWGDRLVARFDSKLDRAQRASANTFIILGFWLEDATLGQDDTFAAALALGFARFVTFLGAGKLDATAIREPLLRLAVEAATAIQL